MPHESLRDGRVAGSRQLGVGRFDRLGEVFPQHVRMQVLHATGGSREQRCVGCVSDPRSELRVEDCPQLRVRGQWKLANACFGLGRVEHEPVAPADLLSGHDLVRSLGALDRRVETRRARR